MNFKSVLSNPGAYFYLRQLMTLGLPYKRLAKEAGLTRRGVRVADIGCGPADILRYLRPEQLPELYVGIDVSDAYLAVARRQVQRLNLNAELLQCDLSQLAVSGSVRQTVYDALARAKVDRALLLGVIHHLSDDASLNTLGLLSEVSSVQRVFTWDVIFRQGRAVNNFLARHDRGECVRTLEGYEQVFEKSPWRVDRVIWTHPGFKMIDYVSFELVRR